MNQTEFTFSAESHTVKTDPSRLEKLAKLAKSYRDRNKDAINARRREMRKADPERYRELERKARAKNPEAQRLKDREYYAKNAEIKRKQAEKRRDKNKEKVLESAKRYREKNPQKVLKAIADWKMKNPDSHNQYIKNRKATDPVFALVRRLRSNINRSIKEQGFRKKSKTTEILGADWVEVRRHIESQFTGGMCWARIGEIQIDHIIPMASASTEAEVLALNHYKNLKPLWKTDNLRKSDRMPCGTSARTLRRKGKLPAFTFTPPVEVLEKSEE
jgi:hypothetical protein